MGIPVVHSLAVSAGYSILGESQRLEEEEADQLIVLRYSHAHSDDV
jgi:hypothetical protein